MKSYPALSEFGRKAVFSVHMEYEPLHRPFLKNHKKRLS
jgi:hypothetical protein